MSTIFISEYARQTSESIAYRHYDETGKIVINETGSLMLKINEEESAVPTIKGVLGQTLIHYNKSGDIWYIAICTGSGANWKTIRF